MYLSIQSQQTCVQAWLAAVMAVHNMNGHEAYNVISLPDTFSKSF